MKKEALFDPSVSEISSPSKSQKKQPEEYSIADHHPISPSYSPKVGLKTPRGIEYEHEHPSRRSNSLSNTSSSTRTTPSVVQNLENTVHTVHIPVCNNPASTAFITQHTSSSSLRDKALQLEHREGWSDVESSKTQDSFFFPPFDSKSIELRSPTHQEISQASIQDDDETNEKRDDEVQEPFREYVMLVSSSSHDHRESATSSVLFGGMSLEDPTLISKARHSREASFTSDASSHYLNPLIIEEDVKPLESHNQDDKIFKKPVHTTERRNESRTSNVRPLSITKHSSEQSLKLDNIIKEDVHIKDDGPHRGTISPTVAGTFEQMFLVNGTSQAPKQEYDVQKKQDEHIIVQQDKTSVQVQEDSDDGSASSKRKHTNSKQKLSHNVRRNLYPQTRSKSPSGTKRRGKSVERTSSVPRPRRRGNRRLLEQESRAARSLRTDSLTRSRRRERQRKEKMKHEKSKKQLTSFSDEEEETFGDTNTNTTNDAQSTAADSSFFNKGRKQVVFRPIFESQVLGMHLA